MPPKQSHAHYHAKLFALLSKAASNFVAISTKMEQITALQTCRLHLQTVQKNKDSSTLASALSKTKQ